MKGLLFAEKCIAALKSAESRCRKSEAYQRKGIQVYQLWLDEPTGFIDTMWRLPGGRYAVNHYFAIRRVDQRKGYIPGNVMWQHQPTKTIFKTHDVFEAWKEKHFK